MRIGPIFIVFLLPGIVVCAEDRTGKEKKTESIPDKFLERIAKLEEDFEEFKDEIKNELDDTGMRSLLDEHLELGGEIELELIDSQRESNATVMGETDEASPHLQIDKVRLTPEIRFTKKDAPIEVSLEGDIDFLGNGNTDARIKEIYAQFEGRYTETMESRLRIGRDDMFMSPDRDTESWPLPATAFWRQEELGFLWRTEIWDDEDNPQGRWTLHASLSNGTVLEGNEPGEDNSFDIIGQSTRMGDGTSSLRKYGFGIQWEKCWLEIDTWDYFDKIDTDALVFYYNDLMGSDDDSFAADNPVLGMNTAGRDGKELWGVNGCLQIGELEFKGTYIEGRDGMLDRSGGYVQGSYDLEFDNPLIKNYYISGIRPIVRYGVLRVDSPARTDNALTWNRKRWTFALITELRNRVLLKTEYYLNEEETGGADPDTDELLIQLELSF